MNVTLGNKKVLHVVSGKGWYIDENDSLNYDLLKNSNITRECSKTDILNNPCLYVMSNCNGKCLYCYQDKHLMENTANLSYSDIEYFITELNKLQDNSKPKTIELFGGEPLLRKDIFQIIELLKEYGYKILLATNGTLPILKDSRFQKLIKDGVHIRISLDGHNKQLHEKYRTAHTFEKIVENIKLLRATNIDVSVKSIISDYNFPYIIDILRFLRDELDVQNWNYNVLYKLEAYHKNCVNTHIDHYCMIKELCNKKYNEFLPMLKQTPFTQMLISVYIKHTKRYRRTYIFLNYDRKIYMNDQLIEPEYSIGDLHNLDLPYDDFVRKYESDRVSCQNCVAKDYCYLGNYGELYKKAPSLMSEFPTCDILRKSVIYLMKHQNKGIKMLRKICESPRGE